MSPMSSEGSGSLALQSADTEKAVMHSHFVSSLVELEAVVRT